MKRSLQKLQNLPYDCWGVCLTFLDSSNDFFSISMCVKGLFNYCSFVHPNSCRHILFVQKTDYAHSKKRSYVLRLRCVSTLRIKEFLRDTCKFLPNLIELEHEFNRRRRVDEEKQKNILLERSDVNTSLTSQLRVLKLIYQKRHSYSYGFRSPSTSENQITIPFLPELRSLEVDSYGLQFEQIPKKLNSLKLIGFYIDDLQSLISDFKDLEHLSIKKELFRDTRSRNSNWEYFHPKITSFEYIQKKTTHFDYERVQSENGPNFDFPQLKQLKVRNTHTLSHWARHPFSNLKILDFHIPWECVEKFYRDDYGYDNVSKNSKQKFDIQGIISSNHSTLEIVKITYILLLCYSSHDDYDEKKRKVSYSLEQSISFQNCPNLKLVHLDLDGKKETSKQSGCKISIKNEEKIGSKYGKLEIRNCPKLTTLEISSLSSVVLENVQGLSSFVARHSGDFKVSDGGSGSPRLENLTLDNASFNDKDSFSRDYRKRFMGITEDSECLLSLGAESTLRSLILTDTNLIDKELVNGKPPFVRFRHLRVLKLNIRISRHWRDSGSFFVDISGLRFLKELEVIDSYFLQSISDCPCLERIKVGLRRYRVKKKGERRSIYERPRFGRQKRNSKRRSGKDEDDEKKKKNSMALVISNLPNLRRLILYCHEMYEFALGKLVTKDLPRLKDVKFMALKNVGGDWKFRESKVFVVKEVKDYARRLREESQVLNFSFQELLLSDNKN